MINKIIERGKELKILQGHDRLHVDLAKEVTPLSD